MSFKNFFVMYDLRGIQDYIYKTDKIKHNTGASYIVKNIITEAIEESLDLKVVNWKNEKGINEFSFFENNNVEYAEYVYEGGGNLLLAVRFSDIDDIKYQNRKYQNKRLNEFNDKVQLYVLNHSYSLSLAYATTEFDSKDQYLDIYRKIKEELKLVKKRMPLMTLAKPLPICDIDTQTGFAFSSVNQNEKLTVESKIKLDNYNMNLKLAREKELDKLFDKTTEILDSEVKTMLAVVHIDGNDMGGIIAAYMDGKDKNIDFKESVKVSRTLSYTIENAFGNNVEKILANYRARIVIESGDDITFISKSCDAFKITKEIQEMLENNYLGSDANNIFTSCAGICFIHRHFPFSKAYEIAEECCSNAKNEAKKKENKIKLVINNKEVLRPASYVDFQIIDSGLIKNIANLRNDKSYLYLRPYRIITDKTKWCSDKDEYKKQKELNSFLNIACIFLNDKNNDNKKVSRSAVKEVRNTYEKSVIDTKILFKRLESRKNLNLENYEPFITNNGIMYARYYDASQIVDFLYEKNECRGD